MLEQKEQAYKTLFSNLLKIGTPHIPRFTSADRETVLKCIKDSSGRFLSGDKFEIYVGLEEEETKKPKFKLQGDAQEAFRDYYDAVHTLCKAQTNFMRSTQLLEQKIEDKDVFLAIIKQVQLPAV